MSSATLVTLLSSVEAQRAAADADERDRKLEHIELALDRRSQVLTRAFDRFAFVHEALPEIDFAEIDLSCEFLGKRLRSPLLISCMTGGTDSATQINRNLALAAQERRVALGVGSQRKAIERPQTTSSFQVRDFAPTVPLLGNLGAVQLNYGFGIEECRRAVAMIAADGLALHLNPLQEAIQPEGQRDFRGLFAKILALVEELEVPVVVKEIGCGISGVTARRLVDHGVSIIDTAGVGGTSWARIEAARGDAPALGELFADWGVSTPDSIRQLAKIPGLSVIGSGGVRSGLDVAKAIALGADLVGLAQPFLAAALESPEKVAARIAEIEHELKITMFCVGARTLADLKQSPLIERSPS